MFKANISILLGTVLLACPATTRAADGREVFVANCASCHGTDGKARTPAGKALGAKDLAESKLSDADIQKQIVDGAKNTKMPTFKGKLSPEEIAALVVFVKGLRQ